MICQVLYNAAHIHIDEPLSEEDGGPAYKQLAVFARRLHSLGRKYGIDAGAHFHARWILSLPQLVTPSTAEQSAVDREGQLQWRTSLSYAMRIKASYVDIVGGDDAMSSDQRAVLTHALVSHLCGYHCSDAFHYATHLVHEQVTEIPDSVLPITWNTLLTTATALREKQDIIFTMNALSRHCNGADVSESAAEKRLHSMIGAQDSIDDSYFTDCIYSKPIAGVSPQSDPPLLMAILRAHLTLNNGELCCENSTTD